MIIERQILEEVLLLKPQIFEDDRGYFFESFKESAFEEFGLRLKFVQDNVVYSNNAGIIRGLHYQLGKPQGKLVHVIAGAIKDVAVDIRLSSKSFGQWAGVKLSAKNHKQLWVPEGFAHGFQTLEDDTEVIYQMSQFYSPNHSDGFRWNDPSFKIEWPADPKVISSKDRMFPNFKT